MFTYIKKLIFIGVGASLGLVAISFKIAFPSGQEEIEYIPKVQHYSVNINQYESKGIGKGLKFLNHTKDIMQEDFSEKNTHYWKFKITDVAVFEGNGKYLRFRIINHEGKHLRHEYLQLRDALSAKVFIHFLLQNEPIYLVYDILFKNVNDQNNGLRYLDHPAVMVYNTKNKTKLRLYDFVDSLVRKHRRDTGNYGFHFLQMAKDYIHNRGTFSPGYKEKMIERRRKNDQALEDAREKLINENLNNSQKEKKIGTSNEIPILQGR